MRTLHNQILNPSHVTDGPMMDDDGGHVETDNCNDEDDE